MKRTLLHSFALAAVLAVRLRHRHSPARRGYQSNIPPIHSTRRHAARSSRCELIITAIFSRRLSQAPQRAWWTASVRA